MYVSSVLTFSVVIFFSVITVVKPSSFVASSSFTVPLISTLNIMSFNGSPDRVFSIHKLYFPSIFGLSTCTVIVWLIPSAVCAFSLSVTLIFAFLFPSTVLTLLNSTKLAFPSCLTISFVSFLLEVVAQETVTLFTI